MYYCFSSDEIAFFFPVVGLYLQLLYCTTSAFLQTSGCIALISKQSEMCRLVPSKGISSYFHITKPQSYLFVRLR